MRRKIVSLVVGAAMALSMVACGTQGSEESAVQNSGEQVADSGNGGGAAISILNSKRGIFYEKFRKKSCRIFYGNDFCSCT